MRFSLDNEDGYAVVGFLLLFLGECLPLTMIFHYQRVNNKMWNRQKKQQFCNTGGDDSSTKEDDKFDQNRYNKSDLSHSQLLQASIPNPNMTRQNSNAVDQVEQRFKMTRQISQEDSEDGTI